MQGRTSDVATADFLDLLTVQLKNQDPISPVNHEDFVAQLSQLPMLLKPVEIDLRNFLDCRGF